jgi:hypothetical protein
VQLTAGKVWLASCWGHKRLVCIIKCYIKLLLVACFWRQAINHNTWRCLLTYLLHTAQSFWRSWPVFAANQEIPAFYGTRRFFTVLTRAHHLSLSWANSMQSPRPPPTSSTSFLILSSHLRLGLPNGLFPSPEGVYLSNIIPIIPITHVINGKINSPLNQLTSSSSFQIEITNTGLCVSQRPPNTSQSVHHTSRSNRFNEPLAVQLWTNDYGCTYFRLTLVTWTTGVPTTARHYKQIFYVKR